MRMRCAWRLGLAAGVLFALVGCGDDDGGSHATPTAPAGPTATQGPRRRAGSTATAPAGPTATATATATAAPTATPTTWPVICRRPSAAATSRSTRP